MNQNPGEEVATTAREFLMELCQRNPRLRSAAVVLDYEDDGNQRANNVAAIWSDQSGDINPNDWEQIRGAIRQTFKLLHHQFSVCRICIEVGVAEITQLRRELREVRKQIDEPKKEATDKDDPREGTVTQGPEEAAGDT